MCENCCCDGDAAWKINQPQPVFAEEEGEDEEDVVDDSTKGRKHVCAHCGKRFNRPSSLKIHEHSHTGAKRESDLSLTIVI